MRLVGVIQARTGSSRLWGKVLAPILGMPMAWQIYQRLRACQLDDIVFSIPRGDTKLAEFLLSRSIPYSAGSELYLVSRHHKAACQFAADAIVRITGDCPLVDPAVVDRVVSAYLRSGREYASNVMPPTYPDGLDVEVVSTGALDRMLVTPAKYQRWFSACIRDNPSDWATYNVEYHEDLSHLRWTVDYAEDLQFVREVYKRLGTNFEMQDVLDLLEAHPELQEINSMYSRGGLYA